jgi:hypothetical protein
MIKVKFLLTALAVGALAACGGGGGGSTGSPLVSISGVATKGLINKGNVELFLVDAAGTATLYKTYLGITGSDGAFTITDIPAGSTVLLKVTATPGSTTMIDEATGTSIDAPSDLKVQSVLKVASTAGATNTTTVDTFSNIGVEKATAQGGLSQTNIDAANTYVSAQFQVDLTEVPKFSSDGKSVVNNRAAKSAQIAEVIKDSQAASTLGCTATSISDRTSCVVNAFATAVVAGNASVDSVVAQFNSKQATVEAKADKSATLTLASAKTSAEVATFLSSPTSTSSGSSTASSGSSSSSTTSSGSGSSTSTASSGSSSSSTTSSGSSSSTSTASSGGSSSSTLGGGSTTVPTLTDAQEAHKFFDAVRTDLLSFKNTADSSSPSLLNLVQKIKDDVATKDKLVNGRDIETVVIASKMAGFLDDLRYTPTINSALISTTGNVRIGSIDGVSIYCSLYADIDTLKNKQSLTSTQITNGSAWAYLACRNPKNIYTFDSPALHRITYGSTVFMQKPASGDEYTLSSLSRIEYESRTSTSVAWSRDTTKPVPIYRPASFTGDIATLPKATITINKPTTSIGYTKNVNSYTFSGDIAASVIFNPNFVGSYETMYVFPKSLDTANVSFKATLDDTAIASGIVGSYKVNLSGLMIYKDANSVKFSSVELLDGTAITGVNGGNTNSGYDSQTLKVKVSTYASDKLTSSVQADINIDKYKTSKVTSEYAPTLVSIKGTFSYADIGSASIEAIAEPLDFVTFDPSQPQSSSNLNRQKGTINGTLKLAGKSEINITLTANAKFDLDTFTLNYNTSGTPTFWTLTGTRNPLDSTKNTATWSNSGGLKMTIDNKSTATLTKNDVTIGTYSKEQNKISYIDGTFESF